MNVLTKEFIADEFLVAAAAAGLKKVFVLVGKVCDGEFVVTMSLQNPTAIGENNRFLVSSCPYEFDDVKHVRQIAADKAAMFARVIPTIH